MPNRERRNNGLLARGIVMSVVLQLTDDTQQTPHRNGAGEGKGQTQHIKDTGHRTHDTGHRTQEAATGTTRE